MNETLTGKTRYLVEFYGILNRRSRVIFQVEVQWKDGPDDWRGMPEYLSGKSWRNAQANDLQYLKC